MYFFYRVVYKFNLLPTRGTDGGEKTDTVALDYTYPNTYVYALKRNMEAERAREIV